MTQEHTLGQCPSSKLLERLLNKRSPYEEVASKYANSTAHKIEKSLGTGEFSIKYEPIRSKSGRLQRNHRRVDSNNEEDDRNSYSKERLRLISNQQHKRLMNRLIKEQGQLDENRKKNMTEMKKKRENQFEKLQQQGRQRIRKINEEKRRSLCQKAKQREENQLKRQLQWKQTEQKLNAAKNQKHLYQIIQQNYKNQVLFPGLEEKKQKLKQRRELRKPMSIQQLKVFQKQYVDKKHKLQSELTQKRKSAVVQKYEPPQKSIHLKNILEQQSKILEIREQEKRKSLQNKLKRTQEYGIYLRQNFKPRLNIKRSVTPVAEPSRSVSRKKRNEKQLGNNYMQYSKKIIKKQNSLSDAYSSIQTDIIQTMHKAPKLNYLNVRNEKQYDNLRQKRLNKIIHSQHLSKQEKLKELNRETKKLDQFIHRKDKLIRLKKTQNSEEGDVTQKLLASVRAKVGMLGIIES